jgi:DNA recombination protein RmuC
MSTVVLILVSAAAAAAITWFLMYSMHTREMKMARKEYESLEELHRRELENNEKIARQAQENYERALKEMKETVLASMTAETERLLKQREKELKEGNVNNMDSILNPLKESIKEMKKAMKENAETHVETTAKLSEQFKHAVKEMQEKTSDVGKKADNLSEALTGKPKVQGCFGENFLDAILTREGLQEGLHYTREAANDDLSRPDFVFHFKDGFEQKDLIVDSKVSLTAFVDYMNAEDEASRAEALDRHIKSIRKHIDELAKKEYAKKVAKPFADYVLMFMPRDVAFRVALEKEPGLWQGAYQKNVLIATEQTIMPFLKIMQLTWNKFQHDTNTQKITLAAQNMIDRVAAFYDSYTELGRKLKSICTEYNKGITKLQDSGQSITTSARQVISLGIRRSKGKEFNVPEEMVQLESEEK